MKGPTIWRLPCGSARRTSNPSPRSRVRGTMTSSSASQDLGSPSTGSLVGIQLMGVSVDFVAPSSRDERNCVHPRGASLTVHLHRRLRRASKDELDDAAILR